MKQGYLKTVLFCTIALPAAVVCLRQGSLKDERELIANGKDADAGRFESFVSVQHTNDNILPGFLITTNVVAYVTLQDDIEVNDIQNITIGRLGDLDERSALRVEQITLNTFTGASMVLVMLDSDSTKIPATLDAGNCEVGNGCLDVSVVGRGDTNFGRRGSSDGLDQTLQQADFTLLDAASCLSQFDGETMYYDFLYHYAASIYGCADLECAPNKTAIIKEAELFQDIYANTSNLQVDFYEEKFQAGEAVCLKTLEEGICQGDLGAPVYTQDDILVGLVPSEACLFEGIYDILPVSILFISGLIEDLETGLENLTGAKSSLTKAAAGTCSCVPSSASAFSPSVINLVLLASATLTTRALI